MRVSSTIPFLDATIAKDTEVINILREWLKTQKHLPQISDDYLQLFYEMKKPSIERTKELIDNHFTIKTLAPELFSNRIQTIKNQLQYLFIVEFKERTKDDCIVILSRLRETNIETFDFDECLKSLIIHVDSIMARQKTKPKGLIIIMDMAPLSLAHLSKFNLITFKKFTDYLKKGLHFRLYGIHVVNKQPFTDKLLFITKPFLTKKMLDLLHFHGPVTELADIISIEHFPSEYGGQEKSYLKSSNDLHEFISKEMIVWFEEEGKLRVNEQLRSTAMQNSSSFFGVEGSIRKLNID